MEELIRELVHMGLSDKEASVYLAALELGPAVVQDIAKKSKVNRATTYVMIESLISRGLMSTFTKGKKRFFSAESPDRLLSIVRLQRRELEEKEEEIRSALPRMQALYNAEGERPQVRYLEGPEGLRTIQHEFETLSGDVIQILPLDDVERIHDLVGERERHLDEISRQSARFRALIVMEKPDFSRIPLVTGGEIRIIPTEKFPIHGEVSVRESTIYMFSFKSAMLGLVVTSKELADTFRAIFELAWVGAEQYPTKKIG